MGTILMRWLSKYISRKRYLLETIVILLFTWAWAQDRLTNIRDGRISTTTGVEFGLWAFCMVGWSMDAWRRSVLIGMSRLGAAAFSIIAAAAWVSFLVVKMNHTAMLGVIAVFVVGQLLLIALPEVVDAGCPAVEPPLK